MTGKVAPGGFERFRRRHKTMLRELWSFCWRVWSLSIQGEMQAFKIHTGRRHLVGSLGIACPRIQSVVLIKELKEETSKLQRDMGEMVPKKEMEGELAKLRREMEQTIKEAAGGKSRNFGLKPCSEHPEVTLILH